LVISPESKIDKLLPLVGFFLNLLSLLFAVLLKSCLLFCEGIKCQTAVFLEEESFLLKKVKDPLKRIFDQVNLSLFRW
jgi:hypothetical protein